MTAVLLQPVRRWADACSTLLTETWKPAPSAAAVARIATCLWLLLVGPASDLRRIARLPLSFWEPPLSPLRFLDSPPPDAVLALIGVVVTVATVLVVIGFWTPLATLAAGLSLALVQPLTENYGAARHRAILPTMLILMSASGWGNRFSLDARLGRTSRSRSWPIALTLLFLAVTMFMAVWPKITTGWLDPSFSAVEGHVVFGFHYRDATPVLGAWLIRARVPWELFDIATVALESAFVLAVWRTRSMRALLIAALCFHFGVLLALDIPFGENVFVYLVAFPLTGAVAVFDRCERRVGPDRFVVLLGIAAVAAAVVGVTGMLSYAAMMDWPMLVAPFVALAGLLAARRSGGARRQERGLADGDDAGPVRGDRVATDLRD